MGNNSGYSLGLRLSLELAVIVAGILIALWTNAWWEDRQNRREAFEILTAITEDVVESRNLIREDLERQEQVLDNMLMLSQGSSGEAQDLSRSDLHSALYDVLWETPQITLQMTAYQEIKSSGRLSLIEDPDIRRILARYDTRKEELDRMFADQLQHQQTKLDPYAIANFQMSEVFRFSVDASGGGQQLPVPSELLDHLALIDELEFQNLLASKYFLIGNGRERAAEVSDLLDEIHRVLTEFLNASN